MTRKTLHLQWVTLSPGQTDLTCWFNIVHNLYLKKKSSSGDNEVYSVLSLVTECFPLFNNVGNGLKLVTEESQNEGKIEEFLKLMSPLHETVIWYKICPAGWQAMHWDI